MSAGVTCTGVDVRRVRVHRSQRRSVPSESIQSVRVAHRRQLRRRRCRQQLHHLQQSLVLARSLHAAGRRHRTEVSSFSWSVRLSVNPLSECL